MAHYKNIIVNSACSQYDFERPIKMLAVPGNQVRPIWRVCSQCREKISRGVPQRRLTAYRQLSSSVFCRPQLRQGSLRDTAYNLEFDGFLEKDTFLFVAIQQQVGSS